MKNSNQTGHKLALPPRQSNCSSAARVPAQQDVDQHILPAPKPLASTEIALLWLIPLCSLLLAPTSTTQDSSWHPAWHSLWAVTKLQVLCWCLRNDAHPKQINRYMYANNTELFRGSVIMKSKVLRLQLLWKVILTPHAEENHVNFEES